jgi:hypothetical protein
VPALSVAATDVLMLGSSRQQQVAIIGLDKLKGNIKLPL